MAVHPTTGSSRRTGNALFAGAGRVFAAAGATLMGTTGMIGFATPTASAAAACSDVEVVFARGTAEPVGVGRVGQAFVDSLKGDVKGKTVSVYAVDYPASYDFLKAADGANDASAHIQATVASCPATSIVLGGYSQGAAVMDFITAAQSPVFGFADVMPPDVADHVAAVAVFGNPSDKIGHPLPELSPLYGAKTIDLCNGADPVCSDGDDRAAHSLYVEAGLASQAASFAADRLTGRADAPAATPLAAGY
jgi:cutinase-like protein